MGNDLQNKNIKVGELRGHALYRANPSLVDSAMPTRIKPSDNTQFGEAYMIAPGTGEIMAKGTFGFVQEKEVDSEQFVKIYLAGIRQYGALSKAGALLFEYIYHRMSGKDAKDKDTITISLALAQEWNPKLTKTTYYRGLSELLDKEFIYRSYASNDLYYVNVRFMFNGDRMVLAQAYRRKGTVTQGELPLLDRTSGTVE